jgi:DNA-binding MarR family transcriptional regulator
MVKCYRIGLRLSSSYTGDVTKGVAGLRRNRGGAAEVVPLLVADVFHLAGVFRKQGDAIAGLVGRTQAEWQFLSAISDGPRTVPQVARRLGYARQSVQRTADHLESKSLVRFAPNPDHKKSALVELTAEGLGALDKINMRARTFHAELAARVDARALVETERFLRVLCDTLDPMSR